MKKVSKLTTGLVGRSSQQPITLSDCKTLDDAWVKKIFASLHANYGALWSKEQATPALIAMALDVWGRKLNGLSPEMIRYGLDCLPVDYPPTPMRFRLICLAYRPPVGEDIKKIPHVPYRDSKVGVREMKKIRRSLSVAGARNYE